LAYELQLLVLRSFPTRRSSDLVGWPMSLTCVPLPSVVVMTVLCGGEDFINPSPRMYISSSFGINVEFAGPGDAPALCQISRCLVLLGRGCLHDPNAMAGR